MELSNKTFMVTGGAGFIGSHLVDALLPYGKVRVLDDLSTGHAENLIQHEGSANFEFISGDIRNADQVSQALKGVDIVFHLACRGVRHSIGNPQESHDVNAGGTLALLQAARTEGIERFIHISSSEVYGTARHVPMDEDHPCYPETVYGAAKLAGEAYSRAYHQTYGLPTVVVRPFNNFGPRSHFEGDSGEVIPRFCVWALGGQPPVIFGSGTQTRDFIYVEETAHWLCRVAECDALVGQTVNLGSGKETSVLTLAETVYRLADQSNLKPVMQEARPGDVMRHLAGAERAEQLLGFELRIGLEEGIKRLLAYLKGLNKTPEELAKMMQAANWTLTK